MRDVQSQDDDRNIPIDKVGVNDLRYPITVLDRDHSVQHTIATLSLSVSLPHHFKGTHMSRFIEVLNSHKGEFTVRTIPAMLIELRQKLDAESAHMEVRFPYFLKRSAPASGATALMDYQCTFSADSRIEGTDF